MFYIARKNHLLEYYSDRDRKTSKVPFYAIGSCSSSNKLDGCSFDSDSCDFVDVPFDDDHDFVWQPSGGQDNKGKPGLLLIVDLKLCR